MIISDKEKKWRMPRWIVPAVLGSSLLVILTVLFWPGESVPPSPQRMANPGMIHCGAETIQKGQFVSGPHQFGNGLSQSDQRARSGRFSSALGPSDRMQFGMNFTLEDPVPGALYRAEVWRLAVGRARGYLAVQGKGKTHFYRTQQLASQRDPQGWDRLRIHFQVPPDVPPEAMEIYVYADGRDTVYFDDLSLTLLAQPQADSLLIDTLGIELPSQAMEQLKRLRADALELGVLENRPDDWVKGRLQEPEAELRLRLKGDWLDHLNGPKWSFRVQVKSPYTYQGFPVFSLQDPATRYYLHEWLLHKIWEREDILTTTYDFVQVQINDELKGVYALEEHFETGFLDRHQRREGVVIRFQEDGFWSGLKRQLEINGHIYPALANPAGDVEHAPIEAFDKRKVKLSPTLQEQYRQAQALLEQFRTGSRPASDIFALDKLARYYAVCDLLDAYHSIKWHNQRFYFDPIVQRLEPVGFDGFGTYPEEGIPLLGLGLTHPDQLSSGEIFSLLFMDTAFVRLYHQELNRLTHPAYLEALLDDLRPEIHQRLYWLQADGMPYSFSETAWIQQVQNKRQLLWPDVRHSLDIRSFHRTSGGRTASILNRHSLPLLIIGFQTASGQKELLPDPIWLPASAPRIQMMQSWLDTLYRLEDFARLQEQAGKVFQKYQKKRRVSIRIPSGTRQLLLQLPGTDSTLIVPYEPEPAPLAKAGRQVAPSPLPPVSNALYRVKDQSVQFYPGLHRIEGDLLFPKGYEIHIPAGTRIDLTQGAKFLSYSPVFLHGHEDNPIKILSSDGRNGGFTVLQPQGPSELHFVDFSGLKNLEEKGWSTTGAVTFYGADVQIAHCYFRNNVSEDALNLVDCRVDLDQIHILEASADGLDLDQCTGTVKRSKFIDTENDGLDCSGSQLRLSDLEFGQCRDKAISIGEASDIFLERIQIRHSNQALVVKDLSTGIADQLTIDHCQSAFKVYQKKHTFGGGHLRVGRYEARQVRKLYEVGPRSSLQLAGQRFEGDAY
jgi:hypothetical protein